MPMPSGCRNHLGTFLNMCSPSLLMARWSGWAGRQRLQCAARLTDGLYGPFAGMLSVDVGGAGGRHIRRDCLCAMGAALMWPPMLIGVAEVASGGIDAVFLGLLP